jgi:predicted Fe-Mo cluster-binding NifX family protein
MRTITHWLVTIIAAFALSSGASAQTPIRIAVAATAPAADAAVSKVAARAPHIVIFDGEGKLLEAHPNPAAANPSSAGAALARWLSGKNVQVLIAGEFGGKLSAALAERKIRQVVASGPANKAVREAKTRQ